MCCRRVSKLLHSEESHVMPFIFYLTDLSRLRVKKNNNTDSEFCAKWHLMLKKKTLREQTYNCMCLWEVVFVVQAPSRWHVHIWACRHLPVAKAASLHTCCSSLLSLFTIDLALSDLILCGNDRLTVWQGLAPSVAVATPVKLPIFYMACIQLQL